MPNPACVAYDAYRVHLNTAAVRSEYLAPWDCLSKEEQRAWWAAIRALAGILTAAQTASDEVQAVITTPTKET